MGRQPVVDRNREVVGYELLFRPLPTSESADDPAAPEQLTGDQMTNDVIFSALGIGIARLTGGKTVFCNADRGVLTGQVPVSLPPKQTVIEVLETVTWDDEVLAGCRALSQAGYRLAADDFTWYAGAEELLNLVDIVKIDLRDNALADIPSLIERCRRFDVALLAEKIETAEELAACQEMDFDLYQGYFLGRPSTVTDATVGPGRLNVVRLASAILDDNVEYRFIEEILRGEPALGYQLLQLAAIGRFGEARRDVRGLREALVLIGLERLRGWLPALLLRPAGRAVDTTLPAVLGRARMAEALAVQQGIASADYAFTAAMLSAFDLLLGVPRENLPAMLEIPPALQQAAFGSDTPLGQLIGDIIDYELYGFDGSDGLGSRDGGAAFEGVGRRSFSGADPAVVARAAAQAFTWAMSVTEMIDRAV